MEEATTSVASQISNMPTWHTMLNEATLATGYSIRQLAIKLGLSIPSTRRLLNGSIKNPNFSTFHKILGFYCATFYSKH